MYTRRRATRKRARRSIKRVRGRGAYWDDVRGAALSTGGAALGGMAGAPLGPVGMWAGGALGTGLGSAINNAFGRGAYNVQANSLLDEGSEVPSFGNMSQAVIVRHREYIKDIIGPAVGGPFNIDSFPINPGNPKTFPWLSQLADLFDQYTIVGMLFQYKSTSTDSTAITALGTGTVMLGTDYDSADNLYGSKIEMENSQFCVTSKPQEDVVHAIECDPSVGFNEIKYVRGIAVPAGKDVRLYDHGNFQIATQGLPNSAGSIGELWCTYEVALYKPQFLIQGQGSLTDEFTLPLTGLNDNFHFTSGTTVVRTPDVGSSIGGSVSANTYFFPAYIQSGTYMLNYIASGANTTLAVQLSWGSLTNCVARNYYENNLQSSFGLPNNTGAFKTITQVLVKVTGSGASVNIQSGTLPNSLIGVTLTVMSCDDRAFN